MKIVIAGTIDLEDPDKREQALLDARPYIEGALTQDGCLYYAWTADFLTPGRIYVYEEWSSQEALAAHLAESTGLGPDAARGVVACVQGYLDLWLLCGASDPEPFGRAARASARAVAAGLA